MTYKDVIRRGITEKIDHLDESSDNDSDDSGDGSEDSGSNRKRHSKGSIFQKKEGKGETLAEEEARTKREFL